eukprot:NODE_3824_length_726_cov_67.447563_g2970_i1.p1 GENE.NODE_3824_length_726_cov_67.447563_g2970_i1~~NODE_3824_length_726_cov_67.447563_g2970_i1.p1  ORF type:complete len:200 (-),score=50.62 NODE_3824_length_726_cov_67.447563_g2970_i1:126-701(-)
MGRYNCYQNALYVLVRTEPGYLVETTMDTPWLILQNTNGSTRFHRTNPPRFTSFSWIPPTGTRTAGFEARLSKTQGDYSIVIHTRVVDSGGTKYTCGTHSKLGQPRESVRLRCGGLRLQPDLRTASVLVPLLLLAALAHRLSCCRLSLRHCRALSAEPSSPSFALTLLPNSPTRRNRPSEHRALLAPITDD